MMRRVTLRSEVKFVVNAPDAAVAKASPNRAPKLREVDPKRDDLALARVKSR